VREGQGIGGAVKRGAIGYMCELEAVMAGTDEKEQKRGNGIAMEANFFNNNYY
jgi:hypothetical protein